MDPRIEKAAILLDGEQIPENVSPEMLWAGMIVRNKRGIITDERLRKVEGKLAGLAATVVGLGGIVGFIAYYIFNGG